METFLIRALQLIMSLSLLVIIHEGGHFLFARLFKIRVEKFCLFFDPWFTLFKFKPKKSETEYAVGWLPLGGYVKIAGMIDESMDTEQKKKTTGAAVGVSFKTGRSASDGNDRRCTVQLPLSFVYLFHDSFQVGRLLCTFGKHDLRNGIQRTRAENRFPRR